MEDLWSKYDKIKEVFYRDFVYDSSYTEQASCIPLSSVKNGVGQVGDGTINLAQHLQFLYTEMVLGNKTEDDVRNALLHHWTFLPDMDTDKVKPWDRVSNRNKNLKYKVKVKRGANNWYFSGGFR